METVVVVVLNYELKWVAVPGHPNEIMKSLWNYLELANVSYQVSFVTQNTHDRKYEE